MHRAGLARCGVVNLDEYNLAKFACIEALQD